MKAIILKNIGDVNQLQIEKIDKPSINANQLLIKTAAFSINPIEIKTRKGNVFGEKLLQDKPSILGWDASGVVVEKGENVKQFNLQDRVFGVIGFPKFGKTYAEYFVAEEKDLCLIPNNVSFEDAAVSNIVGLTAYQALKHNANLQKGSKILIHAAAGGVGHFGVQIAKSLGAEVYATASEKNRTFVTELGADHFIDYKTRNFEHEAQNMDVVFDLIGGDYIDRSLNCLKEGGTIISIPSATNAEVEEKAKAKNRQGVRFIMDANQTDLKEVAKLLESGQIKPFISKTFSIEEIREAHTNIENGHTRGKVVINSF